MIKMQMEADFSSWSISKSLKKLLINEEKWPDYFSIDPEILETILHVLAEQLETVDFFLSPTDTNHFFKFLEKLVESKPKHKGVLHQLSEMTVDVLDKISLEARLNDPQISVTLDYLNLLSLMLQLNHCSLFNTPEISTWVNDFQKVSNIPFNSSALLSQFRHALLLSFECRAFIKNYPALIQTIADLSQSVEKIYAESADSNELSAMKLLDTLGALDHFLKKSEIRSVVLNQTRIKQSIQETRNLLYNEFKPFVEEDFLQYIVFKTFLQQSYKELTANNLTQLCESSDYRAQCNADYVRFKDSHNCPPGQFPDFSIAIQHNNRSDLEFNKLCTLMRTAESFVPWMEDFGLLPHYNVSRSTWYFAASERDFRMDKFLFERDGDDPSKKSYTVMATTYLNKDPNQANCLVSRIYSHTTAPALIAHESNHPMYGLFVKDLEFDLTTTEGTAELHATGVCPIYNMRNLRNFVNDTFIFEFLKARKYPFYFNALKWVAYLVNEKPTLFKTLIELLQSERKEAFYEEIDTFIANSSNIQAFVAWSNQQFNLCEQYLSIYPEAHEPPFIYLDDIRSLLNLSEPNSLLLERNLSRRIAKRSLPQENRESEGLLGVLSGGMSLLPLWSLGAGFFTAGLDDIGQANRKRIPSLPAYINYGFRPLLFAAVSAGLNDYVFDDTAKVDEQFSHFFTYWMMNSLGVLFGQALTEKMAEKIHNKLLCFFMQSLVWTMLWNPSLFMVEEYALLPVLVLSLQLLQGVFFKTGEISYTLAKNVCTSTSSFWHKKDQPLDLNDPVFSQEEKKAKLEFSPV